MSAPMSSRPMARSTRPRPTGKSRIFPIIIRGATPDSFGGYYFQTLHLAVAPAAKSARAISTGSRSTPSVTVSPPGGCCPASTACARRPSISYDVPDPDADGFVSMDEYYLFFGGLDHYDFKLLGKKEMYVPYNNNRLYTQPAQRRAGPQPTPIPTICVMNCIASGWWKARWRRAA